MNEDINENLEIMATENCTTLTIDYVLKQIEKITTKDSHIHEALGTLIDMQINGVGDIANQSKALAIADVVKCRETTNQQLLKFYDKMYDDLVTNPLKAKALDIINRVISEDLSAEEREMILDSLETVRHITNK